MSGVVGRVGGEGLGGSGVLGVGERVLTFRFWRQCGCFKQQHLLFLSCGFGFLVPSLLTVPSQEQPSLFSCTTLLRARGLVMSTPV